MMAENNFLTVITQFAYIILQRKCERKKRRMSCALAAVIFFLLGCAFLFFSFYGWIVSRGISSIYAALVVGMINIGVGAAILLTMYLLRRKAREHEDTHNQMSAIVEAFFHGLCVEPESRKQNAGPPSSNENDNATA